MRSYLRQRDITCPVLVGDVRTAQNRLRWVDEPASHALPFRVFGR